MTRSIRTSWHGPLSMLARFGLASALSVSFAQAAITNCTVNTTVDDPATASASVNSSTNSGTLRDCILVADLLTASTGAPTLPGLTIAFDVALSGATIALDSDLPLLFNNTTIDASTLVNPVNIDGGNAYRIFFVSGLPPIPVSGKPDPDGARAIAVTLRNLSLQHGLAKGGDSSGGGGGGMGAGGALFINKGASVTLTGVSFVGNAAQGGNSIGTQQGGGGGIGAGTSSMGGGGLGSASAGDGGAGLGTGGVAPAASGGWGGQGLGQLSNAQGFNASYFDVDGGSGASGLSLIGGGGSFANIDGGFGGGGARLGDNSGVGTGGFGGGGGGVASSNPSVHGNGGFGGGGGGANSAPGGDGGFGGGGAANSAAGGGVGGGGGPSTLAGGGAAFGGAVFVRAGGNLTLGNTGAGRSISGGNVTVAAATATKKSGAAAGSGLFLMSGATSTFDVASSYTISDSLADDSQSTLPAGQMYTAGNGAGAAIAKQGAGTLVLSGVNTYAGATTISGGILRLVTPGSIAKSVTSVAAAATLTGNGTSGTVNSFGTIAPGTTTNSQSTLHVTGALHLQLGALTCFHADGGNAISDINVTGGATLNGIARIDFSGSPSVGAMYFPLSASSVSGTFAGYETNMPNLLGHFTYGATSVTFTVDASDVVFRNGMEQSINDSPCIAAFAN